MGGLVGIAHVEDGFVVEELGLVAGLLKQFDHLPVGQRAAEFDPFGLGQRREFLLVAAGNHGRSS